MSVPCIVNRRLSPQAVRFIKPACKAQAAPQVRGLYTRGDAVKFVMSVRTCGVRPWKQVPLESNIFNAVRRNLSTAAGRSASGKWTQTYNRFLDAHPVATKGITSAVIGFLGDVVCQSFFEKDSEFNLRRSLTFGTLGVVLVGPTLHWWYGVLGRYFASGTTRAALGQLACDQLAFGPMFMGLFMSTLMVLEGRAPDVPAHLQQHWPEAVVANWIVWVPANFINFRFVPLRYRVLFSNAVAVIWNIYLSYASHKKVRGE